MAFLGTNYNFHAIMARRVLYELFVQIIVERPRVDKHNGFPHTHKKVFVAL